MIIASSNLQLASSYSSEQYHQISETLYGSASASRPQVGGEAVGPLTERVTLSDAGKAAGAAAMSGSQATAGWVWNPQDDPKIMLLLAMLKALTGHSFRIFGGLPESGGQPAATGQAPVQTMPISYLDLMRHDKKASEAPAQAATAANAPPAGIATSSLYTRRETYMESEETHFAASGTVKTADGREIGFQLELSMSRAYREDSFISQISGQAARTVDPLVLNFAGTAAQLTNERFAFDLDADGDMEHINFVAQGSGFLVFDHNQDGVVNDGSELFGPTTNNGFAELAALDDDGNGWIDENDAAFNRLQIWTRDAEGKDQLQSLAAAGVGAISLSQIATPFDLKTTTNELLGQIRSSGIFLQESGRVATIQQVDLTV